MPGILRSLQLLAALASSTLVGSAQQDDRQGLGQEMTSTPVVQPAAPEIAADRQVAFQGYVQLLAARARREGVSEATIRAFTEGLTLNPRVIGADRSQPGTASANGVIPPVAPYLRQHVDSARITRGRTKRLETAAFAAEIKQKYGVPVPILLAIWGHETDYGAVKGSYDLAQSLATLAFEGRRRELFASEFVAVLKIADQGVPRSQLRGSWAGAFGNPQFLPSMYLRLAVDSDGDGVRNVWSSTPDTLASIANYFQDAGWRPGQPWGVAAAVPESLDRSSIATLLNAPTCSRVHMRHSRWLTVREWRGLGVQPQAPIGEDVLTSLFQPDGPGTRAWLLTGNYRVILHYNCSNYYALSVGLLADEIAR